MRSRHREIDPYPLEVPSLTQRLEINVSKILDGTVPSEFGSRLASLRRAAGYSQRELGQEIGISQRMIAYYEVQADFPPANVLPKLARILGVTVDELLGLTPVRSVTKKPQDTRLWRRFKQVERLPAKERRQILQFIDTYLEREKLRDGTAG